MKIRVYDGTFGCCWLLIALIGLATLTACSTSHFQVFSTFDKDEFDQWVISMKGSTEQETVENIINWQHDNMEWEGGIYGFWPTYRDAFHTTTNCAGFAVVAMEALHRLGYTDWQYMQIDTKFAAVTAKWHVILINQKLKKQLSNGTQADYTSDLSSLAKSYYPDASSYTVFDYSKNKIIYKGIN